MYLTNRDGAVFLMLCSPYDFVIMVLELQCGGMVVIFMLWGLKWVYGERKPLIEDEIYGAQTG